MYRKLERHRYVVMEKQNPTHNLWLIKRGYLINNLEQLLFVTTDFTACGI